MKFKKKTLLIIGFALVIVMLLIVAKRTNTAKKPLVQKPKPLYVALGDSVAAGLGLATDSDTTACYRTDESYPHYVAKSLDYTLENFACSGATVNEGILGSQDVNGAMFPPQINQLSNSSPGLITITIGANDVEWTKIIAECFTSQCGGTKDSARLSIKQQNLAVNLKNLLQTIKEKTNGKYQTIITGYYNIFPSSQQQCSTPSGLTNSSFKWLQDQTDKFNGTIQSSITGFSFAKFAPIDFSGHELCTKDTWIQDLQSKAPFHPNAEGQISIGKSIVAVQSANN